MTGCTSLVDRRFIKVEIAKIGILRNALRISTLAKV
jgi:hypothetical protein